VVQDEHGPLLGLEPVEAPLELLAIRDGTGVVADRALEHERAHLL